MFPFFRSCGFVLLLLLLSCDGPPERARGDAHREPEEAQASANESGEVAEDTSSAANGIDGGADLSKVEMSEPRPPEPSYEVFDLLENRALSARLLGRGVVFDLQLPWAAQWVHGALDPAWTFVEHENTRFAALKKDDAVLRLPLSSARAREGRFLSFDLYCGDKSSLEVSIGGHDLGAQTLTGGDWQRVDFELPEGALKPGENQLELRFGRSFRHHEGRLYALLRAAAVHPAMEEAAFGAPLSWTSEGGTLAVGEGIAMSLWVPIGASLRFEGEGALEVEVEDNKGQRSPHLLSPSSPLNLKEWEDDAVHLELRASSPTTITKLALSIPGVRAQMGELAEVQHVVIWLSDTLRADHVKAINPSTDVQSPNFDALADRGVVFKQAYVEGNESKVSHASLFSGLYPIRHRHYRSSTKLKKELLLLPEALQPAEITTVGYVANGYVSKNWGFVQGWDTFINTLRSGRRSNARALYQLGKERIEALEEGERLFLYLGTTDPHVHYYRHEEFIELYDPKDAENLKGPYKWKCSGTQLHDIAAGRKVPDAQERARIVALYKNEITYNDKYFGALMKALEEKGILEQTLVVLVSDHGDEFWEHGGVGHARTLYEEVVHVPLIVAAPGRFKEGEVVAEGVDVLDLYPTVLGALGIPRPSEIQGQDLAPLVYGEGRGYPRSSIATMGSRRYAFRLGRYKGIFERSGEANFFDLASDPQEQAPLSNEQAPWARAWLRASMGLFAAYRSEWSKPRDGVPSNLSSGFYR